MGKTVNRLPLLTDVQVATDDLIPLQDVSKPKTSAITIGELIKRVLRAGTIITAMIADKAITKAKLADQETPKPIPYANGWVLFDSAWGGGNYWKDRNNVVHIQGIVKNGTNSTICTLPAGYRPTQQLIFESTSNDARCRVDVYPDGRVIAGGGYNNAWVSLSNVHYYAAD